MGKWKCTDCVYSCYGGKYCEYGKDWLKAEIIPRITRGMEESCRFYKPNISINRPPLSHFLRKYTNLK